MSLLFRASLVSLSSILATGCSASYPTEPSKAEPIALQVQYVSAIGRVRPGSSHAFTAYSLDRDGAYELVTAKATWTSSDVSVVRPTSTSTTATFSAVAPGVALVTARYEGLEASAWAVVLDPQLQIFPLLSVNPTRPAGIGRSSSALAIFQQNVNTARMDVTNRVTWTSADPGVATITQNGVITAVGPGTTVITAVLDGLTDWFWLSIAPSP